MKKKSQFMIQLMKLEKVENMSERETLETPQLNPLVNPSSATIPGLYITLFSLIAFALV